MITHKYNRIKKTEPKGSTQKHWCTFCDRQLVRVGERCPVCKKKEKTKHRKP